MKNQYFGDINDYRKYGLLRSIERVTGFQTLVAWMLTPDDGSTDGKLTNYLSASQRWSKYDPELYDYLRCILKSEEERKVAHIEDINILRNADFFSESVPDVASERKAWFSSLSLKANGCRFVFLDPDNGIEIKSKPYGRKDSSKFLYWCEVKDLWKNGKSLLIYQHFIRENRDVFIQRMLSSLKKATHGSYVMAFSTPHVVFLMALQPDHHHTHEPIVKSVQENWKGQIKHWELIRAQQVTPADAPKPRR